APVPARLVALQNEQALPGSCQQHGSCHSLRHLPSRSLTVLRRRGVTKLIARGAAAGVGPPRPVLTAYGENVRVATFSASTSPSANAVPAKVVSHCSGTVVGFPATRKTWPWRGSVNCPFAAICPKAESKPPSRLPSAPVVR